MLKTPVTFAITSVPKLIPTPETLTSPISEFNSTDMFGEGFCCFFRISFVVSRCSFRKRKQHVCPKCQTPLTATPSCANAFMVEVAAPFSACFMLTSTILSSCETAVIRFLSKSPFVMMVPISPVKLDPTSILILWRFANSTAEAFKTCAPLSFPGLRNFLWICRVNAIDVGHDLAFLSL